MTEIEELINWLDLLSVFSGEEFVLSSGEKSNIYVDVISMLMLKKLL